MSLYTGNPFTISKPAAEIAAKFDDLTTLQPMLERLTDEQRAQVGQIAFGKDTIAIQTKQMGEVKFQVTQHTPEGVTMSAVGLPLPLQLQLTLNALSADSTQAQCSVNVDVPAMLRPMLAPQLNKVTEMLTQVMQNALNS